MFTNRYNRLCGVRWMCGNRRDIIISRKESGSVFMSMKMTKCAKILRSTMAWLISKAVSLRLEQRPKKQKKKRSVHIYIRHRRKNYKSGARRQVLFPMRMCNFMSCFYLFWSFFQVTSSAFEYDKNEANDTNNKTTMYSKRDRSVALVVFCRSSHFY